MRIKLIANPTSGGNARHRIDQAVSFLTKKGAEVDVVLTSARGDARLAAAKSVDLGVDRIVAAGGDGTLNEVVNGIYPSRLPIAFLPMGTVNVFALETGIPLGVEQACQLALHGFPKAVSLGRVNDDVFLLMVSVGWDAEAVCRLRPGLKKVFGRMAYGISALEALLVRTPTKLEVSFADGTKETGFGVIASNCRYYGGRFVVTPNASIFNDSLEVCILQRPGRMGLLAFAARLVMRAQLRPTQALFRTAQSLAVEGEHIQVQVDGDPAGVTPVKMESLPNAVRIVLPEKGAQRR